MKELTNYQEFQLERYGDILPTPEMEISEPGIAEAERFAEWSHDQHELQLWES